jgi:hypothetical protein
MTEQQGKPTREQIEMRAYQMYIERGAQDGSAVEDWLAAERELTQQMAPQTASAKATQPIASSRTAKRDAAAA